MLHAKCYLLLVKVSFRVCEIGMQTLTLGFAHVLSSPWKHLASTIESSFHLFIIWCISVDTLRSMLDILRSLSYTVIQIKNQRTWERSQGSHTLCTLQPLCSSYVILDQSLMSILYVMKHSKTTTTSRKTGIALTPTHSSSCPRNTCNTHNVPNFGNGRGRDTDYGSQQENCTKRDTKLIWNTYHMHLC